MPKAELTPQQMRDFLARVKAQTEEMVAEGVNREELTIRVDRLEAALDAGKPQSELAPLLDDVEATLAAASSGLSSAGVLNFLNEIFGTGVPPV